jgi:hypothetical protein
VTLLAVIFLVAVLVERGVADQAVPGGPGGAGWEPVTVAARGVAPVAVLTLAPAMLLPASAAVASATSVQPSVHRLRQSAG